ncbi:MAG: membrane protein [Patescibacteria group bacterium]|nr:MAG: membrane protein [Patescibacteria group bacterium]
MDIFLPLQKFADFLTFGVLRLERGSHLSDSVNFFVYDSLKIFILLLLINYLMAAIRFYIPTEKIRDFLTKRKWCGLDYLLASFFGVITPFCSCSSIPLFVGFLSAGIPLGVTLSFLITSPLVNEASIAVFIGLFGMKITFLYVLAGVLVGVVGGIVLGKMGLEKEIDENIRLLIEKSKSNASYEINKNKFPVNILLKRFWKESWDLTRKIFVYVLIGVGVGAFIHGYVPMGFFETYLKNASWWSVPVAAILAVPLYSNAVGVIPVMEALVQKGVPFGTALSFMMATVGLSFPEALILKRAMKIKLLVAFFVVVTLGIISIGYIFNSFSVKI